MLTNKSWFRSLKQTHAQVEVEKQQVVAKEERLFAYKQEAFKDVMHYLGIDEPTNGTECLFDNIKITLTTYFPNWHGEGEYFLLRISPIKAKKNVFSPKKGWWLEVQPEIDDQTRKRARLVEIIEDILS